MAAEQAPRVSFDDDVAFAPALKPITWLQRSLVVEKRKAKRGRRNLAKYQLKETFISRRSGDVFFVVMFSLYAISAWTFDYISAFLPPGTSVLAATRDWRWPPSFVVELFHMYSSRVDTIMQMNPVWLQFYARVALVLYGPLFLTSVPAFIYGKTWIRTPLLLFAWGRLIETALRYQYAVDGPTPARDVGVFLVAYVIPNICFCLVLFVRLRNPRPFATPFYGVPRAFVPRREEADDMDAKID